MANVNLHGDPGERLASGEHEVELGEDSLGDPENPSTEELEGFTDEEVEAFISGEEGEEEQAAEGAESEEGVLYEIPGRGEVSEEDLSLAFEAFDQFQDVQKAWETVQTQNEQLQRREAAMGDAMRINALMQNPAVRTEVEAAVAKAMSSPDYRPTDPSLNGQSQDPVVQRLQQQVESMQTIFQGLEAQQGAEAIDAVHSQMRGMFGNQYSDTVAREAERIAGAEMRRTGVDPGDTGLMRIAKELALDRGFVRNASNQEVKDAMKHRRATQVVTGSSPRSSGKKSLDPLKLSEEQVQRMGAAAAMGQLNLEN